MNHDLVAKALCGRYVRLSDTSGYLESNHITLDDGTLIGAYVVDAGNGHFLITDDGDTTFRATVAGADITGSRLKRYKDLAESHGVALVDGGRLSARCESPERLPFVLASFIDAAGEIAALSVKHRPKDQERFEALVGKGLAAAYRTGVSRRPTYTGLSGHQIVFPFALKLPDQLETIIQPVASKDGKLLWGNVYEAGGKFKDVRGARDDLRLVAVLEQSEGTDRARRYFADTADVVVYRGGEPLKLVA